MWGGAVPLAYAVQGAVTVAAMGAVAWLTRTARPDLRNAAVCAAALLSTPYVLDYDLVVLGMGAAFLVADGVERGFLPWEKSLLALVWIAPLVSRAVAESTLFPLGRTDACDRRPRRSLALRRALLQGIAIPPFTCRVWPVT